MNHEIDIVLQYEADVFSEDCVIFIIVCICRATLHILQGERLQVLLIAGTANIRQFFSRWLAKDILFRIQFSWTASRLRVGVIFFLSLEHNGLILIDPALVLDLTLNRLIRISNDTFDNGTNATHVEEKILANQTSTESTELVPDCNRHVGLGGDMSLIHCHF